MRKFLLSLTVLAGATVATASVAHAAPVSIPVYTGGAQVQTVQYYEGWRAREWRRHERYEHWRRHEEWRRYHQHREVMMPRFQ